MLSILLQIIAASRIYWVDLDISTKNGSFYDCFCSIFGHFRSIFGVRTVLELNSVYFSDFSGVSGYFMLHFTTLGDENKTKNRAKTDPVPEYHGTWIYKIKSLAVNCSDFMLKRHGEKLKHTSTSEVVGLCAFLAQTTGGAIF